MRSISSAVSSTSELMLDLIREGVTDLGRTIMSRETEEGEARRISHQSSQAKGEHGGDSLSQERRTLALEALWALAMATISSSSRIGDDVEPRGE